MRNKNNQGDRDMGKLEGKIALVTGGNSGIGLATAKEFVGEGACVFITGRRDPELAAAVKEIGYNVTAVRGDVSKLDDLDRLSFAKTPSGGQVIDLSALIRRESHLDDHTPAPRASTPPVPLRRPPAARAGEPRLAPTARRVQEIGDPAEITHN
jgi:hypothetical protein